MTANRSAGKQNSGWPFEKSFEIVIACREGLV